LWVQPAQQGLVTEDLFVGGDHRLIEQLQLLLFQGLAQVAQQQGAMLAVAMAIVQGLGQGLAHQPAVGQACEGIVQGHALGGFLDALALGDVGADGGRS
jgi:hypothetical protein